MELRDVFNYRTVRQHGSYCLCTRGLAPWLIAPSTSGCSQPTVIGMTLGLAEKLKDE